MVGFIVHTLCCYSGVVATAVGNKFSLQAIGLKSCKSRVRVQQHSTNKYIPLVSCDSTFRYSLLKWIFAEPIELWNQDSLSYGVWSQVFFDVVHSVSSFPDHNYWSCGMEVSQALLQLLLILDRVTQASVIRILTS